MSGGDGGEVGADDEGGGVGVAVQEVSACGFGDGAVVIGYAFPFGVNHLAGVVHTVAGDDGFFALGLDAHGDVAGRVSRGGFEPDFVGEFVVGLNESVEVGIEDGLDGLFENRSGIFVFEIAEVIPLGAAEEILGVLEGRDPFAVGEHRVPADMIGVEMGAENGVDAVFGISRVGDVLEKRAGSIGPDGQGEFLVVAEAGVDEDALSLRFDNEGMDAADGFPALGDEMGHEPGDILEVFGDGIGQEEIHARRFEFKNFRDGDVADFP